VWQRELIKKVICWTKNTRATPAMDKEHPGDAGDEEGSEGFDGSSVNPPEGGGEEESDRETDEGTPSVLPGNQGVVLQVGHIVEGRFGPQLEKEPADMGVEKPARNIIGVLLMVDVLVVGAVIRAPVDGRILEGGRSKEEGGQPDRPSGPEGNMGKQPVITQGDAESGRGEIKEEESHLKGVESIVPQVDRHAGDGVEGGQNEKTARLPVDAIEGKVEHTSVLKGGGLVDRIDR